MKIVGAKRLCIDWYGNNLQTMMKSFWMAMVNSEMDELSHGMYVQIFGIVSKLVFTNDLMGVKIIQTTGFKWINMACLTKWNEICWQNMKWWKKMCAFILSFIPLLFCALSFVNDPDWI